jgi:hypothetical protein
VDVEAAGPQAYAHRRTSSPYATGGGGFTLERRVAVLYLALLLTGDTTPELGPDRRVVGVALQQKRVSSVDDLIVDAAPSGETEPSLRLAIAVRRSPDMVPSDADMQTLFGALLRAMAAAPGDGRCEQRLAIATGGMQRQAGQLAELTEHARNQRDASAFFAFVQEPRQVERVLRDRLSYVTGLVRGAMVEIEGAEPEPSLVRAE